MHLYIAIAATLVLLASAQSTSQSEASTPTTATTISPTDAPISVVPLRDVPADRPVFKMDNNKINLKAHGFNVSCVCFHIKASEKFLFC
jgi:hypothetical protein